MLLITGGQECHAVCSVNSSVGIALFEVDADEQHSLDRSVWVVGMTVDDI